MYIYEDHLGRGVFYTEEFEDRCCEICGERDFYWGEADTLEEALKLLEPTIKTYKTYTNYDGCYLCDDEGHTSECDEFCDGTLDDIGRYDKEFIIECLKGME